jgi:hypothetical protein
VPPAGVAVRWRDRLGIRARRCHPPRQPMVPKGRDRCCVPTEDPAVYAGARPDRPFLVPVAMIRVAISVEAFEAIARTLALARSAPRTRPTSGAWGKASRQGERLRHRCSGSAKCDVNHCPTSPSMSGVSALFPHTKSACDLDHKQGCADGRRTNTTTNQRNRDQI